MNERRLNAIFVDPMGNVQGAFYAINLKTTVQQIKPFRASILPVAEEAIVS